MSEELDRQLEEIAEDFGQRAAECELDLSWHDSEGLFRNEELFALAVALRAVDCGYGWEFDGNQKIVPDWKLGANVPIVQIQLQRPVGPYKIDLAILVTGMDNKTMRIAINCFDGSDDEQAVRRESELTRLGYRVISYGVSQIRGDLKRCSREIAMAIDDFISPRPRKVS